MTLKIQHKKSNLNIHLQVEKCPTSEATKQKKSTNAPWYKNTNTCQFPWLADPKFCQNKNLETVKKVCIFFHGSGETVTAPTIPEHAEYWGPLNQYTPQCQERRFVRQETKLRGWDDQTLQRIYCQEAMFDQEDKTMIKNKIIFSHSMGGLVLSGAIRNKFCDIDSSTSWYTVATPYEGSQMAPFVKQVCERKYPGIIPSIQRYISEFFGYCIPGKDEVYRVYETLAPGFLYMRELISITTHRIKGSLCGTSAFGLNTVYSIPLSVVASYAGYPEDNDGLVAQGSCKVLGRNQGNTFRDDADSKFYRPTTNHKDNTCNHGDGLWGNRRKPCSYYANKI